MPYSQQYLDILLTEGYTVENVVNPADWPKGSVMASYAQFVYENAGNLENPFRISPFELFFIKDREPNAWALKRDDLYLIAIHLSLFELLEAKINAKVPLLNGRGVEQLYRVATFANKTVEYLLFQYLTMFVYYHELAHLNQFRHHDLADLNRMEKKGIQANGAFDQLAHAMEIDADLFATQQVTFHIIQYWSNFSEKGRSLATFESLAAIVSASIFLFFNALMDGWKDFYLQSEDHPHIVVRASYTVNLIAEVAAKELMEYGLQLSADRLILNSLVIAQQLLQDSDKNDLAQYVTLYRNNQDGISKYVEEDMGPFSRKIPWLIANWYQDNK